MWHNKRLIILKWVYMSCINLWNSNYLSPRARANATHNLLHIGQSFTELVIIFISDHHLTICGTSRLSEAITFGCFRWTRMCITSLQLCILHLITEHSERMNYLWLLDEAQHVYLLGSLRLNTKSSWWKVFAWTPRQQGFLYTSLLRPPFCRTIQGICKKSRFWFSSLARACNVNMILYKCSKASINYPRGTTITKSLCQIYCLKDKGRETFIFY
jgi:hypothetical protein